MFPQVRKTTVKSNVVQYDDPVIIVAIMSERCVFNSMVIPEAAVVAVHWNALYCETYFV